MNRLQPQTLPEAIHGPVFVSLNPPPNSISPKEILGQWTYHHPVYSSEVSLYRHIVPKMVNIFSMY